MEELVRVTLFVLHDWQQNERQWQQNVPRERQECWEGFGQPKFLDKDVACERSTANHEDRDDVARPEDQQPPGAAEDEVKEVNDDDAVVSRQRKT